MTKFREAGSVEEQLAAILVAAVKKNALQKKALDHADFLGLVKPFIELTEVQARLVDALAGQVIGKALREKSVMELKIRQTKVLFDIAEILRKLELQERET